MSRARDNSMGLDLAGVARLATANAFTKAQSVAPVALSTANFFVPVDASLSNNFTLLMAANQSLENPTNLADGMVLNFVVKQDTVGSRLIAFGSMYDFGAPGAPVLSTGADKVDFISAYYDAAAAKLLCAFRKAA